MKYSLLLVLIIVAASASDGDWPQFHGPNRDNKSTDCPQAAKGYNQSVSCRLGGFGSGQVLFY